MTDLEILSNLVGPVDINTMKQMEKNLEFFLDPVISIFIPTRGQCPYALEENHSHPGYSFIYYFQNKAAYKVNGIKKVLNFDKDSLTAMSPSVLHQEIIEDYFQSYIAIVIEKTFFENILSLYTTNIPVYAGEVFNPSKELLNMIKSYMYEIKDNNNQDVKSSLQLIIAHLISRVLCEKTKVNEVLYTKLEVNSAITFMNAHISEKITIKDIARSVNMSESYFSKTFKELTNSTPMEYLNILRLEKAYGMLLDGKENITYIADICGFQSASYFSTSFLKKYGVNPSSLIK